MKFLLFLAGIHIQEAKFCLAQGLNEYQQQTYKVGKKSLKQSKLFLRKNPIVPRTLLFFFLKLSDQIAFQFIIKKRMRKLNECPIEIMRFDHYETRRLTIFQRERIIELYSLQNSKRQPMSLAFYTKFTSLKDNSHADWTEYITTFIDELINSQLSVGIYDLNDNERLIGVCLTKSVDYNTVYSKFKKQSYMYPTFLFAQKLFLTISEENNTKIAKGVDFWGFAIQQKHSGKRLLSKLIISSEYLASLMGYEYGICWSSNFISARSMKRQGYANIAEMDVSEFEDDGVKYFEMIEEMSKIGTVWLKEIERKHPMELLKVKTDIDH